VTGLPSAASGATDAEKETTAGNGRTRSSMGVAGGGVMVTAISTGLGRFCHQRTP
jgi:hypothetical protein